MVLAPFGLAPFDKILARVRKHGNVMTCTLSESHLPINFSCEKFFFNQKMVAFGFIVVLLEKIYVNIIQLLIQRAETLES